MPETIDIAILNRRKAANDKKTAVLPGRRRKALGRRRLLSDRIRFWDLGQVNHGDPESPVWEDHPILKTPTFTTTYTSHGVGYFSGVRYLVEPFTNADFAAYTDMMFNYPVTQWKQRYRRIEGLDDYGADSTAFTFDMRFSLRDSSYSGNEENFITERLISQAFLGTSAFETAKNTNLTSYHHYFHNDVDYAGYNASLDELTGQYDPYNAGGGTEGGYFPFSTAHKSVFKVTATNDSSAADVGALTPDGQIDVFLMPQVGFFLATGHSADWKTTESLGLCYQVMPRKSWPRYLEAPNTFGTGGQYGSDTKVDDFIAYQKARSGVQGHTWTFTGVVDSVGSYSYSESSLPAADWTGLTKWGLACNGDKDNPDGFYYSMGARGNFVTDSHTTYDVDWRSSVEDANFGFDLFQADEPFLTAVILMGGQYYYVWDISHSVDPYGNFSCFATLNAHDRFRLSRGISWDAGRIDTVPPQPKDGTGAATL